MYYVLRFILIETESSSKKCIIFIIYGKLSFIDSTLCQYTTASIIVGYLFNTKHPSHRIQFYCCKFLNIQFLYLIWEHVSTNWVDLGIHITVLFLVSLNFQNIDFKKCAWFNMLTLLLGNRYTIILYIFVICIHSYLIIQTVCSLMIAVCSLTIVYDKYLFYVELDQHNLTTPSRQ